MAASRRLKRTQRAKHQGNPIPPLTLSLRGVESERLAEQVTRELERLSRLSPRPLTSAHVVLTLEPDPALAHPALAKATVELPRHTLRAQVATTDMAVSVDKLFARLRRQLLELASRRQAARHPHARAERPETTGMPEPGPSAPA